MLAQAARLGLPAGPVGGTDLTHAELAWAITHEGALDVDDLLDRRTRVGLVAADRDAVAPAASELLSLLLP